MPQKLMIHVVATLALVSSSMTAAGQTPTTFVPATTASKSDPTVDPILLIASDVAAASPYPELTDLPSPAVFSPAPAARPLSQASSQVGAGGVIVARPAAPVAPSTSNMLPPAHDIARQPLLPPANAYAAQASQPITPIQLSDTMVPADRRPSLLEAPSTTNSQLFPAPSPSYSSAPSNSMPIYNSASPSAITTPAPVRAVGHTVIDYTIPMAPAPYSPAPYFSNTYPAPYTSNKAPVVVAYPQAGVYGPVPTLSPVPSAVTPTSRPPISRSISVGKGIYGQPTAYVDGQPVRNFVRWLTP